MMRRTLSMLEYADRSRGEGKSTSLGSGGRRKDAAHNAHSRGDGVSRVDEARRAHGAAVDLDTRIQQVNENKDIMVKQQFFYLKSERTFMRSGILASKVEPARGSWRLVGHQLEVREQLV
jgi:hypothetical protein